MTLGVTKIKKEKPNVSVGVTVGVTPLTKFKVLSRAKRDKNKGKNGKNSVFEGENTRKRTYLAGTLQVIVLTISKLQENA